MVAESPSLRYLSNGAPALALVVAAPLLGLDPPPFGGLLSRVSSLHPDDRPAHLMDCGLSADQAASGLELIDRWLDDQRPSLEALAGRAVAAWEEPDWIVDQWLGHGPMVGLCRLLSEASLPVLGLLDCGLCAAVELAVSIWWLARLDASGDPSAVGPGDARWAAEGERISLLGLADEMSEWPV